VQNTRSKAFVSKVFALGLAYMKTDQRIAVLIDSENLEITVQNLFLKKNKNKAKTTKKTPAKRVYYPEWKSIVNEIVQERTVVRLVYYKKQSIQVNTKFEKFWSEEFNGEIRQPEKSVDPYLIIDAVTLAEKCDAIVILAGDKDYLPLVWYLKSRGCRAEMANFPETTAKVVIEQVDVFHALEKKHVLSLPAKY